MPLLELPKSTALEIIQRGGREAEALTREWKAGRVQFTDVTPAAQEWVGLQEMIGAVNPKYQFGRMHTFVCERLEKFVRDVEEGLSPRLALMMPPRHGKSQTGSVYLPAWVLGQHPDWPIIHTSYTLALSKGFSRQTRRLMCSNEYSKLFHGIRPSPDTRAAEYWEVEGHRGYFVSSGIGGPITGRGARIAIIDDPLKNAEAADSETVRSGQRDWYSSTLYTRLEDQGGILLIMTRWHVDDLGGFVLDGAGTDGEGIEDWDVLRLPAIADGEDLLGRNTGEALWPEKYDVDALERIRSAVSASGPRWWSALYQQNPVLAEGNLLKVDEIRNIESVNHITPGSDDYAFLTIYQGWDLAISEKQGADYTACATVGVDKDNNIYILDISKDRLSFNATMDRINDLAEYWKPSRIAIETTAYQASAFQEANRRYMQSFREVKPHRDKSIRAQFLADRIEAGTVYAPKRASWWKDFKDEAMAFPKSTHDDMVDAVVTALEMKPKFGEKVDEKLRPAAGSPAYYRQQEEERAARARRNRA